MKRTPPPFFQFMDIIISLVLLSSTAACIISASGALSPSNNKSDPSGPLANSEPSITTALPPKYENIYPGDYYFVLRDETGVQLIRLPAKCLLKISDCSTPEIVPGYPEVNTNLALAWSPNGKMGAVMGHSDANEVLTLFNPENNTWHSLLSGLFNDPIVWSPDSNWIAFSSGLQENSNSNDIFIIDPDKPQKLRNLTTGLNGVKTNILWVNEHTILFVLSVPVNNGLDIKSSIYIVDTRTGEFTNLTPDPQQVRYENPHLCPNRSQIGFVYLVPRIRREIRILDLKSGSTQPLVVPAKGGEPDVPFWSQDGEWEAFTTKSEDIFATELYIEKTNGTELQKITQGLIGNITWMQDSRHLVFSVAGETSHFHAYVASVSDGTIQQILPPGINSETEWLNFSFKSSD
jgi:Tol biopolymer transport system component